MSLKVFMLTVACFASLAASINNDELRCYQCNEQHATCLDPVSTADLATVPCKDLKYDSNHRTHDLMTRLSSNAKVVGFSCFKLKIFNATLGENYIQRGCMQKRENVKNSCKLLNSEIKGIQGCYECENEQCNNANIPVSSGVLFGAIISAILCMFQ